MLPITLGETQNGYPTVDIDPPFELFGEYLRIEHSLVRATNLLSTVERVVSGELPEAELLQDYAKLTLRHVDMTARVWVDNLAKGVEEEAQMPIQEFRDIVAAWLEHVKRRQP